MPNIYVSGEHVGGADDTFAAHARGDLMKLVNKATHSFDYDLVREREREREEGVVMYVCGFFVVFFVGLVEVVWVFKGGFVVLIQVDGFLYCF